MPLFSNALGNMQCPQEHLKTIVYATFGRQTKCIMGNSKIDNSQTIINRMAFELDIMCSLSTIIRDEERNTFCKAV